VQSFLLYFIVIQPVLAAIFNKPIYMLQAGIIEPAASPWSANVVLVKKLGDPQNMRLTLDYRFLNNCSYKDRFLLSRINDCLDAMSGSTCFSTLDMSSSFNQVPINPNDRDESAFFTRRGQFRYTVMPMGTTNSPSTFSHSMSLVLKGLTWVTCVVFIDDSIILAKPNQTTSGRVHRYAMDPQTY